MQRAIFVSRINDIPSLETDKFDFLYFGNEFCENLIPTIADFQNAATWCLKYNIKLVFVTPYTSEFGLEQLKELLNYIKINAQETEIVFNDWGVYHYCKSQGFSKLILGRLLNKLERDVRIGQLKKNDSEFYDYLRTPSILSNYMCKYLKDENIERIEFDNVFQGINYKYFSNQHKYSLYYPYLYLTTSRLCPNNNHYYQNKDICKKDCYNRVFVINTENSMQLLYVRGRTVFLKNEKLDPNYVSYFDRIIIQKGIPY